MKHTAKNAESMPTCNNIKHFYANGDILPQQE